MQIAMFLPLSRAEFVLAFFLYKTMIVWLFHDFGSNFSL